MENKKLYNIIKSRLEAYDSPMDVDSEWRALSSKQNAAWNSKLKWYTLAVLALMIGLGILFWQFSSQVGKPLHSVGETEQIADMQNNRGHIVVEEAIQFNSTDLHKNKERSLENSVAPNGISKKGSKENIVGNSKGQRRSDMFLASESDQADQLEGTVNEKPDEKASHSPLKPGGQAKVQSEEINLLPRKMMFLKYEKEIPAINTTALIPTQKRQNQNSFEIYAGAGLFLTRQGFSAKNSNFENHKLQREKSESPLETYYFDIGLNYFLNKKTFTSIGLSYAQWYDKFVYSYEQEKDYFINNALLKVIVHMPSGMEDRIYGDTTIAGVEKVNVTHFNQYSSTNLSLMAGHYLLQFDKFSLGISGGLDWSFKTSVKGKIASPSTTGILELNSSSFIYEKSFGLGLSASIHADYHVTNRLTVQLRPAGSYYFSSITDDNYGVDAKWYRLGMAVGLKYKL